LSETSNHHSFANLREEKMRQRPKSSYVNRTSMFRATRNAIISNKLKNPSSTKYQAGYDTNFNNSLSMTQSKDSLDYTSDSQSYLPFAG
jgi:hypothetical protein